MKNWIKLIIGSALIGVGALGTLTVTNCGVSRSPLLQDPKFPPICKTLLECFYSCQKNPACVGACQADMSKACTKYLIKRDCLRDHPIDSQASEIERLRSDKDRQACQLAMQ